MLKKPATDRPLSILDQRFKYTSASATDLAKKFREIRRLLKAEQESAKEAESKVKQFRRIG